MLRSIRELLGLEELREPLLRAEDGDDVELDMGHDSAIMTELVGGDMLLDIESGLRADADDPEAHYVQWYKRYAATFLGREVEDRTDLYVNMIVSPGMWNITHKREYYWIPSDHPLTWAIDNTWRAQGGVRDGTLTRAKRGACCIYEAEFVHGTVDGVWCLFEKFSVPQETPDPEPLKKDK